MSLRQYIIIMIFATILCWISFGFVIVNIDPFDAEYLSFSFFYISAFFSLLGTLSLIIFGFHNMFLKKGEPLYKIVQESFRDGVILSAVLTSLLYLQGKGLLNMWNTLILVGVLLSMFIFLFFNKQSSRLKI